MMFSHILIPTDLNRSGERPVEVVRELVADRPATISLLHVVQPIAQATADEFREFYDELEERSESKLRALASTLEADNLDVTPHVIYGVPAVEIARFADVNEVDLIVLASHRFDVEESGRGWGTISYRVSMLARCAVLLVK